MQIFLWSLIRIYNFLWQSFTNLSTKLDLDLHWSLLDH